MAVPEWHPAWAKRLAEAYSSHTSCFFLVHGAVNDLTPNGPPEKLDYGTVSQFLATQLFGSWDVVLQYDLGRGARLNAGADATRFRAMLNAITTLTSGPPWPREPEQMLQWLDQVLEKNLLRAEPQKPLSIAVLFDYAGYLVPDGDPQAMSPAAASRLVRFLGWAQNPYFKRVNVAFCLINDSLAELNDRLVNSAHVATIELPLPTKAERSAYIQFQNKEPDELAKLTTYSAEQLSEVSNGLALLDLGQLLEQARHLGRPVDAARFRELKKSLIERQCQGLLQFIEPQRTLDAVVGLEAAKDRLRKDGALIAAGRLEAAPMGYLICGPVGTGKTFIAECYAGEIGIPCVTLRNFRSKYVGETEANLQRVLSVLRSLGPVVVVIDEADAALGTREAEGDSGTSQRVFAMIASQMGDTQYRGKIIWMLLTSRPDRLPIDLKRQGRAEVHIPLFYPHDPAEVKAMFKAMAKKNKFELSDETLAALGERANLSGADVESIVLGARRASLGAGRDTPSTEDVVSAADNFLPSIQGLEKEAQEINAVLECTQMDFLPPHWRQAVGQPNGRARLQERVAEIDRLLGK